MTTRTGPASTGRDVSAAPERADGGPATARLGAAALGGRLPVVVAAVVVVATTMWWGRLGWFGFDTWDLVLDRTLSEPADWVRPHGSHWTAVQFVLLRGIYAIVGLEWWPWFPLLMAALLVVALVSLERTLVRRGSGPLTAAAVAGGTTMLWTHYQPEHMARPIGVVAVIVIATLVGARERWARPAVIGAGLLGVASGPAAAVALGLATVAAIVHGPWRRDWWWPPAVPLAAFVVWRATAGPGGGSATGSLADADLLRRVPAFVVETVAEVIGTGGAGAVLAAAVLVGLVLLAVASRRLDPPAWLLLGTVAGLAVVTLALRPGHDLGRWGTQVVPLVVVALAPCLPVVTGRALAVGAVVAGLLVVDGPSEELLAVRAERRAVFPAVVALEVTGEPMHEGPPLLHARVLGTLSPSTVGRLLDDGYEPPPAGRSAIESARGARRVLPWPAGRPADRPLADLDGCVALPRSSTWDVVDAGTVVVRGAGEVRWRWTDAAGTGVGRTPGAVSDGSRAALHLARGPATLGLDVERDGAELCQ